MCSPVDVESVLDVFAIPRTFDAVNESRVVSGVAVASNYPDDGVTNWNDIRDFERPVVVGWELEDGFVVVVVDDFDDDWNLAAQNGTILIDGGNGELVTDTTEKKNTTRYFEDVQFGLVMARAQC